MSARTSATNLGRAERAAMEASAAAAASGDMAATRSVSTRNPRAAATGSGPRPGAPSSWGWDRADGIAGSTAEVGVALVVAGGDAAPPAGPVAEHDSGAATRQADARVRARRPI